MTPELDPVQRSEQTDSRLPHSSPRIHTSLLFSHSRIHIHSPRPTGTHCTRTDSLLSFFPSSHPSPVHAFLKRSRHTHPSLSSLFPLDPPSHRYIAETTTVDSDNELAGPSVSRCVEAPPLSPHPFHYPVLHSAQRISFRRILPALAPPPSLGLGLEGRPPWLPW